VFQNWGQCIIFIIVFLRNFVLCSLIFVFILLLLWQINKSHHHLKHFALYLCMQTNTFEKEIKISSLFFCHLPNFSAIFWLKNRQCHSNFIKSNLWIWDQFLKAKKLKNLSVLSKTPERSGKNTKKVNWCLKLKLFVVLFRKSMRFKTRFIWMPKNIRKPSKKLKREQEQLLRKAYIDFCLHKILILF